MPATILMKLPLIPNYWVVLVDDEWFKVRPVHQGWRHAIKFAVTPRYAEEYKRDCVVSKSFARGLGIPGLHS